MRREFEKAKDIATRRVREALNYALKRRAGLEVFLSDPEVQMDTNHLERANRPVRIGQKNWM